MSIRPAVAPSDSFSRQMPEGSRSLVDRHTKVDGSVETPYDLRVEGQVSGTLACEGVLYVASGAEIDADVSATDAIVEGTIHGSIACSGRLEIRSTGVVRAAVQTQRLVIHEGAVLEGRLDMNAPEPAEDQPSGAAALLEPEPAPPPSSSSEPSAYSYLRSFSSPAASDSAGDSDLPGQKAEGDERDDEEEPQD